MDFSTTNLLFPVTRKASGLSGIADLPNNSGPVFNFNLSQSSNIGSVPVLPPKPRETADETQQISSIFHQKRLRAQGLGASSIVQNTFQAAG